MNDILIYSGTIEKHYEYVKEVLMVLWKAWMILNIGKCEFFVQELIVLRHLFLQLVRCLPLSKMNEDCL